MQKYTTIDAFMQDLDKNQTEQVTLLRTIIKNAHPKLAERIKWNSPSFVLNGNDRITQSVRPGRPIAVIIHMTQHEPRTSRPLPS